MKRILFASFVTLAVACATVNARAGGWHGGGWGGHGYYHGCGYWGGHGWCGGWWPSFSIGFGFGGYYPSYGYYGYPAYGYAYAPAVYAQPAYVHTVAQPSSPSVSVAVAATTTARPAVAYSKAVPAAVKKVPLKPAVSTPAPVLVASTPMSGTWVLDTSPNRYRGAVSGPSAADYIVSR